MLGSFPPPRERWSMDFFYPNFNNDMWRIIGLAYWADKDFFVDLQHKTFRREAIIQQLETAGIALYDVATTVNRLRGNASDKYLEIVSPTDLGTLLDQMPHCTAVVSTGQKSGEEVCRQFGTTLPQMGESTDFTHAGRTMKFFRMPSTSRAYPLPLTAKADYYKKMLIRTGCMPQQSTT